MTEELKLKIEERYKETALKLDKIVDDYVDEISINGTNRDELIHRIKNIKRAPSPYIYNNEMIGHPFDLQETIDIFGTSILPNCLGIYHLFYEDMLVYIGMSKNLGGRLLQHLKDEDKCFNNVLWFELKDKTIPEVLRIEYNMIKKFKPSLNLSYANIRHYG